METSAQNLEAELLAHAAWMRRLARRLVTDDARADDTAQEAALAALERPRAARSPRAWLGAVVRNAARRLARAEGRRSRREARAARPEALPPAAELAAEAELQHALVAALLALEEPYRSTLVLRFYRELEPAEIARLEGVPAGTVRSRLSRGLELLRARLDARPGGREAWSAALAPLLTGRHGAAVSTAAAAGGIAMGVKLALACVATTLAAALVLVQRGPDGKPGGELAQALGPRAPAGGSQAGAGAGAGTHAMLEPAAGAGERVALRPASSADAHRHQRHPPAPRRSDHDEPPDPRRRGGSSGHPGPRHRPLPPAALPGRLRVRARRLRPPRRGQRSDRGHLAAAVGPGGMIAAWGAARGPVFVTATQEEKRMGLLDGLIGNASRVDPGKMQEEFGRVMAEGERVEVAYQLIRDCFLFTDRRLILVDRQGLTGSKVEYHSIPYRSITHFTIETGGHFDLDAELKIWITGTEQPIQKQFNRRLSIYELQGVLAGYVR